MAQQQNKPNNNINTTRQKAEYEKREINTKGIITAIIVMVVIALADTFFIFDMLKLLFSASPWSIQVATFINVAAAFIFACAAGFGIWAAKQNQ